SIVPTSGVWGEWQGVPLAAMVGDQQASLAGQGCFELGDAKLTLGTGGMLDITGGTEAPSHGNSWRSPDGTYPIVAWAVAGARRRRGRDFGPLAGRRRRGPRSPVARDGRRSHRARDRTRSCGRCHVARSGAVGGRRRRHLVVA